MKSLFRRLSSRTLSSNTEAKAAAGSPANGAVRPAGQLDLDALEPRVLFSGAPVEAPDANEPADSQPAEAAATTPSSNGDQTEADQTSGLVGDPGATLVATDAASAQLNAETLQAIASAARQRWIDAGISTAQLAALDSVTYQISDLTGIKLGSTAGTTITIDIDAGGTRNWFIDETPEDDVEFADGSAPKGFDLLTAVLHEQGHIIGLADHFDAGGTGVMSAFLAQGQRKLPVAGTLTSVTLAAEDGGVHYLTISGGDFAGADLLPDDGDILSGTFTNVGTFVVGNGSTVFVASGTPLSVTASAIFISGHLNGDGAGFVGGISIIGTDGQSGSGDGGGQGGPFGPSVHGQGGAGGGYGGSGGDGGINSVIPIAPALGGSSFGTPSGTDLSMGSGGGAGASIWDALTGGAGGNGGGSITLIASQIEITTTGIISVDGANGQNGIPNSYNEHGRGGGGGSGGGLFLDGHVINNGLFSAEGGSGGNGVGSGSLWATGGGGGGGGRIKLTGTYSTETGTLSVEGGAGGISAYPGEVNGEIGGAGSISDARTELGDTTTVTVDGSGNLVIDDVAGGNTNDNLTIRVNGANFRITDATNGIDETVAIASVTGDIIVNGNGGDDTLTIDLSGGPITRNIVFHGGAGGNDTLVVTGGTFGTVTYRATDATDGVLDFGAFTVTFTGLEPVDLTGSAIANLVIDVDPTNLVAGGHTTTVSQSGGTDTLVTISGGFESVLFRTLTGTLTINGEDGEDDIITVTGVGTSFAGGLTLNGGTGNDTVNLNGDITFAAGRSLSVTAETVTTGAGADLVTSGTGTVTLTTDSIAIDLTSTIVTGAQNITVAPLAAGTSIGLGSGAGTLQLSDAELGRFTTLGTMIVGLAGTGTGAVTIDGVNLAGKHRLHAIGGTISVTGLNTGTYRTELTANTGGITSGGNIGVDINAASVYLTANGEIGSSVAGEQLALTTGVLRATTASTNSNQYYSTTTGTNVTLLDAGTGTVEINSFDPGDRFHINSNSVGDGTSLLAESGGTFNLLNGAVDTFAQMTLDNGGVLMGRGTMNAALIVNDGGVVTPGVSADNSPGQIATGNLTFNSGGRFHVEVDGTNGAGVNPGGHDQLLVTGAVTLDDAVLSVNVGTFAPVVGTTFTIIENDGIDAVTGTFRNLSEGSFLLATGLPATVKQRFQISYVGGDGNDVVLTAVAHQIETRVFLDGGNLIIEDILNATDDQLTIEVVGSNLVITDADLGLQIDAEGALNGAVGDLTNQVIIPLASFNRNVILRLGDGNDTILFRNMDLTGTRGITVEDGAGTDTVTFQTSASDLANGNVTVAAESITVNAAINAGIAGNIALNANTGNLVLNASLTTGGAGTVVLNAVAGAITQADGATISTGSGAVTLVAAGDITIASVSTTGNVVATSTGGAILDGGDAAVDVIGSSFAATAATGVGATGNALETTVAGFEADGGTGGIFVANTGNLTLGGVNGTLSGLDTANADIAISTTGSLTTTEAIDATGGDVRLVSDTVALGAAVTSNGGDLVIAPFTANSTIGIGGGAGALNLNDAELALLTDGFSSITIGDLAAGTGAVDIQSSTFTDSVIIVGGSITVTELNTGANDATLIARTGAITDGGDAGTDVTAANVTLNAGGAVGASGDAISLAATTITTNSTLNAANGNQFLRELDTVTVAGFKAGSGTIEISGGEFDLVSNHVVNDATTLIIEAGATLDADATDTFAGVTVKSGGVLKGDGDLQTTPVTVESGGTVTPGEAAGSAILGTGALTLSSGAVYAVNLNGNTPGATHDQINVTGAVNLGGATLQLSLIGYLPMIGATHVIIANDGGDPVTGTFIGLPQGSFVSASLGGLPDQLFRISYTGGTGNDVVLTAAGIATTNVYLDGSGNLVVEDIQGDNTNDTLVISRQGADYVIEDTAGNALGTLIVGAIQTHINRIVVPGPLVTGGLVVLTHGGNDTITLRNLGNLGGVLTVDAGAAGEDRIIQTGSVTLTGAHGATYTAEGVRFEGTSSLVTDAGAITVTGVGGAGNFAGVLLLSNTTLSSTSGDISLTGQGGNNSAFNKGVSITTSTISTGGAVSMTGTGGTVGAAAYGVVVQSGSVASTVTGSAISLKGTAGGAGNYGYGVFLNNTSLTASVGDLTIDGTGAGLAGTAHNHGVSIWGTALTAGASGNLEIAGTGGNGAGSNYGVFFYPGSSATVTDGDLTVTGIAGGTTTLNVGIVAQGSVLTSNGLGDITLSGTGAGAGNSNHGVELSTGAQVSSTGSGDILILGRSSAGGAAQAQGVFISSNTIVSAGDGDIEIRGTGLGLTASNKGVVVNKSTLLTTGSGNLLIDGTGSTNSTAGSNIGVEFLQGATADTTGTGSLTVSGTGGSGTTGNLGVSIATTSRLATVDGDLTVNATAGGTGSQNGGALNAVSATLRSTGLGNVTLRGTGSATSTGSNNKGVFIQSGTTTVNSGTLTIEGTGGNGLGTNHGVHLFNGTVSSTSGAVSVTGQARNTTTGATNTGIYLQAIAVSSASTLALTGTGGTGTGTNHGIQITGGSVNATGALTLLGQSQATTGTWNTGIHATSTTLNGGGGSLLTGTGGGGSGNNHGVYLNLITTATLNPANVLGTAGAGAPLSKDTAGNFFP